MKTSELRQRFLQYFERQGHRRVASSAVIGPADDPTVMWTNSGMIQFKDVFLGKEKRDYTRATTSQKCLRAGGQHNDLDQVAFPARPPPFLDMLGNLRFGHYFTAHPTRFPCEFLTRPAHHGTLCRAPPPLCLTRREARAPRPARQPSPRPGKAAGVRPDRIMRFGKKDNFWQMGDTGPCGPCSEMHYDRGAHIPGDATPNGEGDRVMEIWNLVFMQYERDAKGVLSPLPRPSIDTGMGLERTASILQGVDSNYEIDLFEPIFEAIWKIAKVKPGERREHTNRTASQVIADHIRAATFMCFDGVVPSNEGRGYVLRKIVRRALRFGRKLGIEGLFFADLAPAVAQAMGDQYPELPGELPRIQKSLRHEERQFSQTLSTGLKILESSAITEGTLAGSDIFRLYDTYGFPVDLVEDWCRERGIQADLAGFEKELEAQRSRARAAMKAHDLRLAGDLAVLADLTPTTFTGYDHLEGQAHVVALFDAGYHRVPQLTGEGYVLLDRTPFYAQSGGQVGDTGQLRFEGGHAEVLDCTAPAQKRHLHKVEVTGLLLENTPVNALVHAIRRRRVRAHHTATHLLHAALREVLGTHVKQAGSVVDEHHLRFDFTHFAPLDADQIAEIERLATRHALNSVPTRVKEMDIEEALASGAMALFGEKYGDVVRVVQVPGFSTELCGGTHVANTGEIGVVKIVSESAVAAGVRRIEAVAGELALELLQADEAMIHGLARQANAAREVLPELLVSKDQRITQLERDLKEAKLKAASGGGSAEQVEQVKGATLVTASVEGLEGHALREFMDQIRTRHRSAIIVLASKTDEDKVAALVSVSPDLAYDAGVLFKAMLPALNGRGGGKKDLAQGGGSHPAGLPEAFAALRAAL